MLSLKLPLALGLALLPPVPAIAEPRGDVYFQDLMAKAVQALPDYQAPTGHSFEERAVQTQIYLLAQRCDDAVAVLQKKPVEFPLFERFTSSAEDSGSGRCALPVIRALIAEIDRTLASDEVRTHSGPRQTFADKLIAAGIQLRVAGDEAGGLAAIARGETILDSLPADGSRHPDRLLDGYFRTPLFASVATKRVEEFLLLPTPLTPSQNDEAGQLVQTLVNYGQYDLAKRVVMHGTNIDGPLKIGRLSSACWKKEYGRVARLLDDPDETIRQSAFQCLIQHSPDRETYLDRISEFEKSPLLETLVIVARELGKGDDHAAAGRVAIRALAVLRALGSVSYDWEGPAAAQFPLQTTLVETLARIGRNEDAERFVSDSAHSVEDRNEYASALAKGYAAAGRWPAVRREAYRLSRRFDQAQLFSTIALSTTDVPLSVRRRAFEEWRKVYAVVLAKGDQPWEPYEPIPVGPRSRCPAPISAYISKNGPSADFLIYAAKFSGGPCQQRIFLSDAQSYAAKGGDIDTARALTLELYRLSTETPIFAPFDPTANTMTCSFRTLEALVRYGFRAKADTLANRFSTRRRAKVYLLMASAARWPDRQSTESCFSEW